MKTSEQEKSTAAQAAPAAAHTAPLPRPQSGHRVNQKALVILGVALALVALVAWMFITSAKRKEAFANRELIRARAAAEQGNLPLAASELQKLIDTYDVLGGFGTVVVNKYDYGDTPVAYRRSLELLAAEVMPAVDRRLSARP